MKEAVGRNSTFVFFLFCTRFAELDELAEFK